MERTGTCSRFLRLFWIALLSLPLAGCGEPRASDRLDTADRLQISGTQTVASYMGNSAVNASTIVGLFLERSLDSTEAQRFMLDDALLCQSDGPLPAEFVDGAYVAVTPGAELDGALHVDSVRVLRPPFAGEIKERLAARGLVILQWEAAPGGIEAFRSDEGTWTGFFPRGDEGKGPPVWVSSSQPSAARVSSLRDNTKGPVVIFQSQQFVVVVFPERLSGGQLAAFEREFGVPVYRRD